MDEREIRLKCLELACAVPNATIKEAVFSAQEYYDFIKGKDGTQAVFESTKPRQTVGCGDGNTVISN